MKTNLNDLRAFIMVARYNSFTRAAQQMGVSQSALSHSLRGLETRLSVKLIERTTRSFALTDAGVRLFQRLSPMLDDIDQEIYRVKHLLNESSGLLRLSGSEHVFHHVLWDKLAQFLQTNPDISLELLADNRNTDIIAERVDAGIRMGNDVGKDMACVRVSDEVKMCVVGSPNYLSQFGKLHLPDQLNEHQCLALRVLASGGLLNWEFADPNSPNRIVKFQPHGKLVLTQTALLRQAALSGVGLVWLPRDVVADDLRSGSLQTVLDDWAVSYSAYYLYYPHSRAESPLLNKLIEKLRIDEN